MAFTFLIPLDGSPFSEQVLEPALRLARAADGRVILLRVVPPAHGTGRVEPGAAAADVGSALYPHAPQVHTFETPTQAAERQEAEARDYLAAVAARLQGMAVTPLVRHGWHPAEEILAAAKATGADVIAMTSHGRTGVAHLLVGSVAEAVVRAGQTPVLLVRPADRD